MLRVPKSHGTTLHYKLSIKALYTIQLHSKLASLP